MLDEQEYDGSARHHAIYSYHDIYALNVLQAAALLQMLIDDQVIERGDKAKSFMLGLFASLSGRHGVKRCAYSDMVLLRCRAGAPLQMLSINQVIEQGDEAKSSMPGLFKMLSGR